MSTNQPSAGAMRAAYAIKAACINHQVRKTCPALSVAEIAEIIDRETGHAELLALVKEYADDLVYQIERRGANHLRTKLARVSAAIAKAEGK